MRPMLFLLGLVLTPTLFHAVPSYDDDAQLPSLAQLLSAQARVLIVAPHPDDADLAAGGLMQRVLAMKGAIKIVYMTSGDGFYVGVCMEDHVVQPTADEYRAYGVLREREASQALAAIGLSASDSVFLGFPDSGLCPILQSYWTDRPPHYKSPFTMADEPPLTHVLLPHTEYDGEDLMKELARILTDFRPTLMIIPHPLDHHPDHCASYFFVRRALADLERQDPTLHPVVLTYLIHYPGWPVKGANAVNSALSPPKDFPTATWIEFALSPMQIEKKRAVLKYYGSQLLAMPGYLMRFVRANELFAVEPAGAEREQAISSCCERKKRRG
jgi:LmbE family N-acetylglucosaminyl deacetylase